MRPHRSLLLLLLALAGCGSEDSPTISTPPPPVTTLLEGPYDLVVTPAPACGLPEAPYELGVEVESFSGPGGNELRATLPGGDGTLVLEMLYARPGWLQGSVSTRTWVTAGSIELFVRASGSGTVTAGSGGRAEVESGTMAGDVSVAVGGADVLTCSSLDHRWALAAR